MLKSLTKFFSALEMLSEKQTKKGRRQDKDDNKKKARRQDKNDNKKLPIVLKVPLEGRTSRGVPQREDK